jgi:microcystin-dependent protein
MSFLQNQVSIEMGAGTVIAFPGTTAPGGWLLCNGDPYSRTTYSALFGVIGTDYGVGNGTTTFNVPNFQAAFLRGAETQTYPTTGGTPYGYVTGTTTARTINTAQGTATQIHNHVINSSSSDHSHGITDGGHNHDANSETHEHTGDREVFYDNTVKSFKGLRLWNDYDRFNSFVSMFTPTINFDTKLLPGTNNIKLGNTSPEYTDNSTTNPNINETIPFNYSINWIIKY